MISILNSMDLETVILILGTMFFGIVLYAWHKSENIDFDIKTILINEAGQFSLSKFGQLISLFTSTWIIIYQTRAGLLSEWIYTGYMLAWTGAGIAGKWIDKNDPTTPKAP